ncbi:protein far1-related sequence 11-like isoform x1 [Gigaspora margarita]|uniref:Protein far1-related sequence 11-like isoform x1 n=1 Tax=Gigaspora margarita TaxID=4874 RepID=A0A8H4AV60_GIGMA|nr:protein far1-related sequence 11-like isoform x1 [Gigaspora margarita]
MLSDEILPAFGSQVPSICSIPRSDILNTNNIENEFINYDISDRNEHQNVEFKDQEKLEIVSGLIFQTWEQLDCHIRMYTKQNGFVSIITCSESDDITCRRCQYACEHQGIDHSKKTAILENQKQAYTKWLGCKWLVNTSCPKKTRKIKINSCYFEHCNHKIHPDTINFAPYYQQFPDEVKQEISSCSTYHITASAQLLPEVDKWLAEFLTAPVLSLQRAEIAEALWYSTKLVSKESINISLPQGQSEVNFYENLDDFLATNVNEIISSLPTLSIQEI